MRFYLPILAAGAIAAGACADQGAPTGPSGPKLNIDIAALTLGGVFDAIWDIQVENGQGEIVFNTRVSSSQYGDGIGSATYIGTCDASPDGLDTDGTTVLNYNQNTVKVWIVGLYGAVVSAPGTFNTAVGTTSLAFQNPTWVDAGISGTADGIRNEGDVNSPLTQTKLCTENADNFFAFNVALMRPANQGFFDIAVNFNDIFCSAKLDCAAGNLLHDGTGTREATTVLGFACSAGDGSTTTLWFSDIELKCGSDEYRLAPSAVQDGNICTAGTSSATDCAGLSHWSTGDQSWNTTTVVSGIFQAASYKGTEVTNGSVKYWNFAFGQVATGCTLKATATAAESSWGGTIAKGEVYPYVEFSAADITTCGKNALGFDTDDKVQVKYTATDATSAMTFANSY